jgi:hypothetical protein
MGAFQFEILKASRLKEVENLENPIAGLSLA